MAIDTKGQDAPVPLKLKGDNFQQLKEKADGTTWVRNRNTISRIDGTTGEKISSLEFKSPEAKDPFRAEDFFPTTDGGMVVRAARSITVNNPIYDYGDVHGGIGGWRPHIPPMDHGSMYQTIEKVRVFKLDDQGKQTWMSADMGSSPVLAFQEGKQKVLSAQYSINGQGEGTLYSHNLNGDKEPFAVMKGYIREVESRDSDGNVFVRSDNQLNRYDADGNLLNSLPLENHLEKAKLTRVQEGAGRPVILTSSDNKR